MTIEHAPPLGHPWRRFFARTLDLALYGLLWAAVQHLLLRWNPPATLLTQLLAGYIGFGLMLACEPLLLHFCGATPGKWLMGLAVRDGAGQRPTLADAFARTCGVFRWGYGWGIPFWQLYRLIRSGIDSENGGLPWDDGDLTETLRDERGWRIAALIGAHGLTFLLTFTVLLQAALLPRHRGELNQAQLAENLNGFLAYHQITDRRVASDGHWIDPSVVEQRVVIYMDDDMSPSPYFSFVPGSDTNVDTVRLNAEFHASAEEGTLPIWPMTDYQLAAVSAFGFAQPDAHLWTPLAFDWERSGLGGSFESWETELFGLRVRNEVSYEGYEDAEGVLLPVEGQEKRFSLVFTLEKLA